MRAELTALTDSPPKADQATLSRRLELSLSAPQCDSLQLEHPFESTARGLIAKIEGFGVYCPNLGEVQNPTSRVRSESCQIWLIRRGSLFELGKVFESNAR